MKKIILAVILATCLAPAQLLAKPYGHHPVDEQIHHHHRDTHRDMGHKAYGHHQRPIQHKYSIHDRQTVMEVQRQLRARGLYHHKIDGIAGFHTRQAIKRYQHHHHQAVNGILTPLVIFTLSFPN